MAAAPTYKRKFPRRAYHARIGVLHHGKYQLADAQVLGEGGLQIVSPFEVVLEDFMVLTFKITGGPTLCLRATVRNMMTGPQGESVLGLEFNNISFDLKRAIRSYVAARLETESLIL